MKAKLGTTKVLKIANCLRKICRRDWGLGPKILKQINKVDWSI